MKPVEEPKVEPATKPAKPTKKWVDFKNF
jgi:hypothetical protein